MDVDLSQTGLFLLYHTVDIEIGKCGDENINYYE